MFESNACRVKSALASKLPSLCYSSVLRLKLMECSGYPRLDYKHYCLENSSSYRGYIPQFIYGCGCWHELCRLQGSGSLSIIEALLPLEGACNNMVKCFWCGTENHAHLDVCHVCRRKLQWTTFFKGVLRPSVGCLLGSGAKEAHFKPVNRLRVA